MGIQTATRNELLLRRNQIEREKKTIEATIQKHRATEQKVIDAGDGRGALASRQAMAAEQGELERVAIEEDAIVKRLAEFGRNKPDAEKLKLEIEHLHNQTGAKHVNRIIRAEATIVENLRAIESINSRIGDLATEYRVRCGDSLHVPVITVPWIVREFARVTMLGSESKQVLQPVEPYRFGR